ncbi:MAG: hypothetical protein ACXWK1_09850 [Caulobacteraceae bacterium]
MFVLIDAPNILEIDVPAPADLPEDRARLDRQLARLDRLADLGLEIAEGLAAQAKGTGPRVAEGDVALAYDRVARAVRMAVMLQSRLIEDVRLARQAAAGAFAGAGADPATARKDRVARIVRRVAEAHGGLDGFQIGWAAREARERLEHDDIYGQVMSQPVSDLVADICRDLGLTPNWARLAEEAWAEEEILSGDVGEALAGYTDSAASPAGGVSGSAGGASRTGPRSGGEGTGEAPPALVSIPTLDERLQALASDPQVLAAARRESG